MDLVGDPQQTEQLSRLLNETFIQDAYRETMLERGAYNVEMQSNRARWARRHRYIGGGQL